MNIQVTVWWYRQTLVRVDISRSFVSLSLFFGGGVQKVFYFPCFGITKHHLNISTRQMASIYDSFSIQRAWTKGPLTLTRLVLHIWSNPFIYYCILTSLWICRPIERLKNTRIISRHSTSSLPITWNCSATQAFGMSRCCHSPRRTNHPVTVNAISITQ